MVGRVLDGLLVRIGYGLVRLQVQADERNVSAAAITALEAALAAARADADALRMDIARLEQAQGEERAQLVAEGLILTDRLRASEAGFALAAETSRAAQVRLWGKIDTLQNQLTQVRARLQDAAADAEQVALERADETRAHAAAQAGLWARLEGLRRELEAARAGRRADADQAEQARAVEAEAHAVALARLWAKIEELNTALEAARGETRKISKHSESVAEQQAATLARVWERLDHERSRLAAATEAGSGVRKQARALERELATTHRRLARSQEKLEAARAARAAPAAQIAALRKRLANAIDERTLAATIHKLELERAKVESVKAKLHTEQKRAGRLASELKTATARAKSERQEAERARGQEQRLLAELAIGGGPTSLGDTSGDPSDAAVAWLSKARGPRRSAEQEATEQFRLGRGFQAQGGIGLAAACFRRVGPMLAELLAQEGPDGDLISGPDFLVIGAARAGTTWLKKCLAHHPQVFILSGEHHYFSTSSHLPPETYVGRFANAHTRFQRPGTKTKQFARPSERLYGEKSTTYLAMPQAQVDLCAALFPKVRLICMVRDPVARVWSHLKHLKMADALRRLDELSDLPPWMEVDELIRQGRYEEHLVHWSRRFDPEQMLLIDFERIAREPAAVHGEVLAHIGAAPAPAPKELDEINRTDSLDMPPALAERLHAAFQGERFDIPHLRAAMERAAAAQRGGGPSARRRSVRLAG